MGLIEGRMSRAVAAWAVRRPHVVLVACPGATGLRLEAEAAVTAVGGRLAEAAADADILLVVGEPARELRAAAEVVWAQVPGPRVRGGVTESGTAREVLRALGEQLARPQGRSEGRPEGRRGREGGRDDSGEAPGPVMAERGPDRDGLALDVLHVPLGPLLPHWPAGLVVDTLLQGDVVQRADARVLAGPSSPSSLARVPFWHAPGRAAASHLDSLGRLLALAGWTAAARTAGGLRDRLLAGEETARVRGAFSPWRRRVERSRLLRWATDGLGVLAPEDARRLGVAGPAARAAAPYDATARWRRWLTETDDLLTGERRGGGGIVSAGPRGGSSRALLQAALELMPGLDLAAARLLLASFDPDPDELAGGGPR